jgi:general nucleoside transport system ATP-binding protein
VMEVAEPGVSGRIFPRPPLVRLQGITKRFGTLCATDGVTFDVPHGRIVALLGENGAGKTTTMNILAGLYCPDAGLVAIDGVDLELGSPRASVAAGVGMVHQHFRLVETLTGLENISLAVDHGRFWRRTVPNETVRALLTNLGFKLNLAAQVWQLALAQRQQLEILRTLAAGARVLLLDEPTSVLSPLESNALFAIMRNIASSGRSVIVSSHKLAEVLAVADDVVVMRQGRIVHRGPVQDVDTSSLAKLIVGERVIAQNRRPVALVGDPILTVERLKTLNDFGLVCVHNVSFNVRSGELVVLVGVTGNGQTELIDAIAGMRPLAAGRIFAPRSDRWRGFAFVPAEQLGTGLAPNLSIADNSILDRHRLAPFDRSWLVPAAVERRAREVTARFGVTADVDTPVRRLSGGNLQRILLGRELTGNPELIVADYPTRGLDVAAAAQIRNALVERANAGAAVLISSEELDESLAIATRLLVMHRGEIVADFAPAEVDMESLGRLITTGRS